MDSKEEFYKSFIDIQKQGGQGLSGIVRITGASANINRWLDELIDEGLVKACDTGGSLGHPESNIFYMPTKGYNVWEDEDPDNYSRHKGRYLHFVRFYLGAMKAEHDDTLSDKDAQLKRAINPAFYDCVRNVEFIKEYAKWLAKNEKALEVMMNLDDFYVAPNITFTEEEAGWIKSRSWYTDNKSITQCLKQSINGENDDMEALSLNKQLINICKKLEDKKSELKQAEDEVADLTRNMTTRKKINRWLETQDKKAMIQSCFNF